MAKKVKYAVSEVPDDPKARQRYRKLNKRTVKKHNRKLFGELSEMRRIAKVPGPGKSMESMLEDLRNRAYALWRYAAAEVDALPEDEFWVRKVDAQFNVVVEPNKWVQYEAACRAELEDLGVKLIGLGLEERRVRIEEAEAEVVTKFLDAVLDGLNLTEAQQQALPVAIDRALPVIEGRAVTRGEE